MNCKFRACKLCKEEICQKYDTAEAMLKDFENGGGCAFTWFFSGQFPKNVLQG